MAEVTLLTTVGPHDHRVPAFLLLATLFTYNYHRLFRGRTVRVRAHTERHRWITRHRRGLSAVMVFSGAGAAGLALRLSPSSLLLLAPFGLVALFYSVLPFTRRGRGIRDVPFAKVFLVALTWAATTAALPLLEATGGEPPTGTLAWECAERFLFILALTIPFDVRDLPHDDPGKRTVPQVVGVGGAKLLALAGLAAFMAIAWSRLDRSAAEAIALTGSAVVSACLVAGVRRERPEIYYTGWLESMMVVQLLLVRAAG